jgi:hypothetical protein
MSIFVKSKRKSSSRSQVQIKSIKDGIIELPNNNYRVILSVSPVNIELKSEDEQDVLIDTYRSILNALSFPMQIVIHVREIDLDKYIEEFTHKLKKEETKLFKDQINNYSEFVSKLVSKNRILTRKFYIIIPFDSREKEEFELIKEQLNLRSDILNKNLNRLGTRAKQLSSLELLEYLHGLYNPSLSKIQPLSQSTLKILKESYL